MGSLHILIYNAMHQGDGGVLKPYIDRCNKTDLAKRFLQDQPWMFRNRISWFCEEIGQQAMLKLLDDQGKPEYKSYYQRELNLTYLQRLGLVESLIEEDRGGEDKSAELSFFLSDDTESILGKVREYFNSSSYKFKSRLRNRISFSPSTRSFERE